MNSPTVFIFPESELERFRAHGLAHARLNQMCPVPISECTIDLSNLVEIAAPAYFWDKHTPQAPHIIIASAKANGLPKDAEPLDLDTVITGIRVRMYYRRPNKREDFFDPIYQK